MHTLTLHNLSLKVTLGVFDFEKTSPQDVILNITLDFLSMPPACETDSHKDAICYAGLSEHLQNHCNGKSFDMIEFLAMKLTQQTQAYLTQPAHITLELFKDPPLDNLEKASFKIHLPWNR